MNYEGENKNKLYEKSQVGPVLYIRHGMTEYNKICLKLSKSEAKVKAEYIDCPLSEEGQKQANEISSTLASMKLKYVFCSPLLRCLETCYLSLLNHSDVENIKVIVHPLIMETISGVHDFSKNILMKKKLYNNTTKVKFDWSVFDNYYPYPNEQECFFLNFIDNCNEDGDVESEFNILIKEIKANSIDLELKDQLLGKLSLYGVKNNLSRLESLKAMFNRNLQFKEYLKDLMKTESFNNDEKILVFTHSAFTKISTSNQAYYLDKIELFPEDCLKLENCEIITMNI
jgi:hypothetical protein